MQWINYVAVFHKSQLSCKLFSSSNVTLVFSKWIGNNHLSQCCLVRPCLPHHPVPSSGSSDCIFSIFHAYSIMPMHHWPPLCCACHVQAHIFLLKCYLWLPLTTRLLSIAKKVVVSCSCDYYIALSCSFRGLAIVHAWAFCLLDFLHSKKALLEIHYLHIGTTKAAWLLSPSLSATWCADQWNHVWPLFVIHLIIYHFLNKYNISNTYCIFTCNEPNGKKKCLLGEMLYSFCAALEDTALLIWACL